MTIKEENKMKKIIAIILALMITSAGAAEAMIAATVE